MTVGELIFTGWKMAQDRDELAAQWVLKPHEPNNLVPYANCKQIHKDAPREEFYLSMREGLMILGNIIMDNAIKNDQPWFENLEKVG